MGRMQNLASALGIQQENWGISMHFSEIIKNQFGKERHIFLYILKLITYIIG